MSTFDFGVTLCGATAFQWHRIPPVVRDLLQDDLDLTVRADRRCLPKRGAHLGYLTVPLSVLATDRTSIHETKAFSYRLWTGELLPGDRVPIDPYLEVTSPAMTLLTMAPKVSELHLTMMVCEFCGAFSSIHLEEEHREAVRKLAQGKKLPDDGWKPLFVSPNGAPDPIASEGSTLSDLWQRPPLLTLEELHAFVAKHEGEWGVEKLRRAVDRAFEGARSPFEIQAALAFDTPRRAGGEGFALIGLDEEIPLSMQARSIMHQNRCYADLLFPGPKGCPGVIVECQGRSVHGASGKTDRDVRRVSALETDGYRMMLITYDMLANVDAYHRVVRLLADKMGFSYVPKSEFLLKREEAFRRELFVNWNELGKMLAPKKKKREKRDAGGHK